MLGSEDLWDQMDPRRALVAQYDGMGDMGSFLSKVKSTAKAVGKAAVKPVATAVRPLSPVLNPVARAVVTVAKPVAKVAKVAANLAPPVLAAKVALSVGKTVASKVVKPLALTVKKGVVAAGRAVAGGAKAILGGGGGGGGGGGAGGDVEMTGGALTAAGADAGAGGDGKIFGLPKVAVLGGAALVVAGGAYLVLRKKKR